MLLLYYLSPSFFHTKQLGHTSLMIGRNYFEGDLPTGGRNGWCAIAKYLFIPWLYWHFYFW